MATRTVDDYVASLPPAQSSIVQSVRVLIRKAAPESVEKFKWAEPVFESNGPFAWVKAHTSHVTLGFWRGAELDPVHAMLETSGQKMGHIKLRAVKDVDRVRLTRLIKDAVRLNRDKGDPSRVR